MKQWALDQGLGITHCGSCDYKIPIGFGVDSSPSVLCMDLCLVATICCTVIWVCQEAQAGLLFELHLHYLQQALSMTDISILKARFSKVTLDGANNDRNRL